MSTSILQKVPATAQPGPGSALQRHLHLLAVLVCAAVLMSLLAACGKTAQGPGARTAASATTAPPSQDSIPPFPWPPPPPSALMVIPRQALLQNMSGRAAHTPRQLKDADAALSKSLRDAGYDISYFAVSQGFAMVARMERITETGAPYPDPKSRFDSRLKPLDHFSMQGYLQALFTAPPGYFRLIVFIVSPQPFSATGKPVTQDEALDWLDQGVNMLPAAIGNLPYSDGHICTALIYEFEKRDVHTDPRELHPGRLSAQTHLAMAGIKLGLPTPIP
jgi:hypothetical protein